MAHAWMPEAMRIRAEADGGALGGGAPRVVWLTLGSLANAVSVQSAAQRLVAEHRPCHLVWNPTTGEIAQLISVLRAGRALGAPDRLDWTPVRIHRRPENVNAEGRVCVQIGVLALAAEPFTNGPHDRRRGDHELARLLGRAAPLAGGPARQLDRGRPGGRAARRRRGAASGLAAAASAALSEGPRGAARSGRAAVTSARRRSPGARTSGPGAIDIHRLTGSGPHGLAVRARELPSPFAAARCRSRPEIGRSAASPSADDLGSRP